MPVRALAKRAISEVLRCAGLPGHRLSGEPYMLWMPVQRMGSGSQSFDRRLTTGECVNSVSRWSTRSTKVLAPKIRRTRPHARHIGGRADYGSLDRDGRCKTLLQATLSADINLKPGDGGRPTWMGYDPPMNVFTDAPSTSYAHNGAPALDSFQAGLRASMSTSLRLVRRSIRSSGTATGPPWLALPGRRVSGRQ